MPDPKTKLPENRIHLFDPVGLINDGYGTYWSSNHAIRPRRATKSYDAIVDTDNSASPGLISYESSLSDTNSTVGLLSYGSLTDNTNIDSTKDANGGGIRLQVKTSIDQDESDVSTPRLWKLSSPTSPKSIGSSTSRPPSPKSVNSSPLHPTVVSSPLNPNYQNHYQTMSPSSRTQAIAKGRKELMEMVRDLPESFYELSLRDIVEKKPEMEIPKEVYQPEEKKPNKEITKQKEITKAKEIKKEKKSKKKVKKSESKKKMVRSRSVDNGRFLLKTSVFPIFSGSKKGKKNLVGSNSFKIAPMPKPQPTTSGSMKGVEKDWWRRRSCIASESEESNGLSSDSVSSESSSSSSRSNSSNGRRSKKFLPSCCFFNGRKIRSRK